MSTMPVISFDPVVMSLATIGTDAVHRFVADLASEPRMFGTAVAGRSSTRWRSMLTHPSAQDGVAIKVDGDLVGIGRLTRRTSTGRELYVAVAASWRRLGLGARLIGEAARLAAQHGEDLVLVAERPKASVRQLAQRFRLQPVKTIDGFHAYHLRCA
jgi:GNAT superfamily N-acetyltransferase